MTQINDAPPHINIIVTEMIAKKCKYEAIVLEIEMCIL